jgi:putative transposase
VQLRYNFRLDPTPAQQAALARAFGCARVVYNDAMMLRRSMRAQGVAQLSDTELQRQVITLAKRTKERAWLAEAPSVVLTQALRDLSAGFSAFFASRSGKRKGAAVGEPRLRSRKDRRESIRFTRDGFRLRGNKTLYLAKIGAIVVRWSRRLPSQPSSVTVIKDSIGRYFASFVVETDVDDDARRFADPSGVVGIDLGLSVFATFSDGTVVDNPKFLRRAEHRLRKAQREVGGKRKGSNDRAKAVRRLAVVHAEVAASRSDFHHKLSTSIIRDNQVVIVEDLAVNGSARSMLAESVHDAGWGRFLRMLECKAGRYGRVLARVDRFFPSSQICSECGHIDGPKPLDVRVWVCAGCGAKLNRDHNAARNIEREGLRILVAAGQAET